MGETVAVASTLYNLAGDPTGRPSYLRSLIIQKQLFNNNASMADTIINGYLSSPSLKLQRFYNWVNNDTYGNIGKPRGRLEVHGTVNPNKVEDEISHPTGWTCEARMSKVGYADPFYWAERHMLNNYPELYHTAWFHDFIEKTGKIKIIFADTSTEQFTPTNFNYTQRYLYTYYSLIKNSTGEESSTKLNIYKIGSGNPDLDAIVENKSDYGEFFPFIPIRIDNEFLSDDYHKQAYKDAKAAYKKAVNGDFDDLVSQLGENENLEDIDHAYIMFGVSLNVKDDASRQYIYKFFQTLMNLQEGGIDAYEDYNTELTAYNRSMKAFETWENGGRIGPQPKRKHEPKALDNKIRISGSEEISNSFDLRINWKYIREHTRIGKGKPGAKPGDLWMRCDKVKIGTERVRIKTGNPDIFDFTETVKDIKTTRLRIYYQQAKKAYTYLEIVGAEHDNMIYKGRSVKIDPKEALDDAEDSGFIIPMHYGVWKTMSLVDRTQMCTACVNILFNSYESKKIPWWQSGFFSIFLVIAIAIVSVLFTGGAGIGLLGSHLAVGTSLGLTGMSAAILGSVVNAMAAYVLSMVLAKVAENFGIIGPIIAAILGIVIGAVTSGLQNGALFKWGDLLRVDNLLKLTNAVGSSAVKAVNEATLGIQTKMAEFTEDANAKALEVQQAFFKEFGYGAAMIDPMLFTENHEVKVETSDTFLKRTLLTGSEVVELSQDLLYNFSEYSLELPNAFT